MYKPILCKNCNETIYDGISYSCITSKRTSDIRGSTKYSSRPNTRGVYAITDSIFGATGVPGRGPSIPNIPGGVPGSPNNLGGVHDVHGIPNIPGGVPGIPNISGGPPIPSGIPSNIFGP